MEYKEVLVCPIIWWHGDDIPEFHTIHKRYYKDRRTEHIEGISICYIGNPLNLKVGKPTWF